jgi:hypothetical protein
MEVILVLQEAKRLFGNSVRNHFDLFSGEPESSLPAFVGDSVILPLLQVGENKAKKQR